MTYLTADTISPHVSVQIAELEDCVLAHKLSEMGFAPGKNITLLHAAPFGDPLAFLLDDSLIALRKKEARLIRTVAVELDRAV